MVHSIKAATLAIFLALITACATAAPCDCDDVAHSPATEQEQAQAQAQESPAEQAAAQPVDPVVLSAADVPLRVSPDGSTSVTWLAEGANAYVGLITLSPGTEVPLHTHESEEYLYILEGGGLMTIDGQDYPLEAGMVVAVPSHTEHGFVNGPEDTLAVQIFADSEGAQRFLEWAEADDAEATDP